MLLDELRQTRGKLQKIITRLKGSLADAPEGKLRVTSSRDKARFYWSKPGDAAAGSYLTAENNELIAQLAQKEYDEKALELAEQQLRAIENLLDNRRWGREQHDIRDKYENLHPTKQPLVTPCILPDDLFVERWQNAQHERSTLREAEPVHITERNECVRSKSELLIANALARHGVPYRYEAPMRLSSGRMICPDFTVLNAHTRKVFYWEHFGMLDDHSYLLAALDKLDSYENSGIFQGERLIVTRETSDRPLGTNAIERVISEYLL